MSKTRILDGQSVNIPARNAAITGDILTQAGTLTPGMSVQLYTGNVSTQSIDNGLDMATGNYGGLVWIKSRTQGSTGYIGNHSLYDTVRGAANGLFSDLTNAEVYNTGYLSSFDANGFSVGSHAIVNTNTDDFVSWNFQTTKKNYSSLGAELITNGDFPTDTTGWTQFDAQSTLSVAAGIFRVTNADASAAAGYQGVATEVGKVYKIELDYIASSIGAGNLRLGTTANGVEIMNQQLPEEGGTYSFIFVATTITTYIGLSSNSTTSGHYAEYDNVTVKEMVGAVPTNRDKPYECHYNPDMNFSIVGYEGDGVAGHEIPHHLPVPPEISIFKNRDGTDNWVVYSPLFPEQYLLLNTTAALAAEAGHIGSQLETFHLSSGGASNGSGNNYISYHFASKSGVCKVGKYIGTGAAGNYVSTEVDGGDAFKPAFVMVKNLTTGGTNWLIEDVARGDNYLLPNSSGAEAASGTIGVDFDDNGFYLPNVGAEVNALNAEYLFIAFADTSATYGADIITGDDYDFESSVGSWVGNDAQALLSVDSTTGVNRLKVLNSDATDAEAQQSFTTVAGQVYEIEAEVVTGSGATSPNLHVGTTAGASDLLQISTSAANNMEYPKGQFVAAGTTTHVSLRNDSGVSGHYVLWKNVRLRAVTQPSGADFTLPTNADQLANIQATISFANGHNANGQVDSQEQVAAGTMSFGAGYEDKKLFIYRDKDTAWGYSEYKPLVGKASRGYVNADDEGADRYGIPAKTDALALDANSRCTDKHFDYESPSGIAYASSEFTSYAAWWAFDKSDAQGNSFFFASGAVTNGSIGIKHTEPRVLKSARFMHTSDVTKSPFTFKWRGSNDGLNWTDIDTTYASSGLIPKGAFLWEDLQDLTANTTPYLYHELFVVSNNGHGTELGIEELELNTVSIADYYLVDEGKMYNNAGTRLDRVYIGECVTDNAGDVNTFVNYPPAKQNFNEVDILGDLTVLGDIKNIAAVTAFCVVRMDVNPPLIIASMNVADVVDAGTGFSRVVFEEPMDNEDYVIAGIAGAGYTLYESNWSIRNKNHIDIANYYGGANTDTNQHNIIVFGGKKV